jgi:hypothetical protein
MARQAMPPVVVLRIETIDLPHPVRPIARRRFQPEVVRVLHEALRVAEPVRALDDLGEEGQQALPIAGVRRGERGIAKTV